MKTDTTPSIPLQRPTAEHRIQITIGQKRYALTISAQLAEVKREPAKVVEVRKRPGAEPLAYELAAEHPHCPRLWSVKRQRSPGQRIFPTESRIGQVARYCDLLAEA